MATKKGSSKKSSSKKAVKKRSPNQRDLVKGPTAMYAKREEGGEFKEMDVVKRAIPADRAVKAKKKVKPGFGDQGDQPKKSPKGSKVGKGGGKRTTGTTFKGRAAKRNTTFKGRTAKGSTTFKGRKKLGF